MLPCWKDGNFPSYVHADLQRHFTSVVLAAMLDRTPPAWTKSLMRIWSLMLQRFETPQMRTRLPGQCEKFLALRATRSRSQRARRNAPKPVAAIPDGCQTIKEDSMWFWFSRTSDGFDGNTDSGSQLVCLSNHFPLIPARNQ